MQRLFQEQGIMIPISYAFDEEEDSLASRRFAFGIIAAISLTGSWLAMQVSGLRKDSTRAAGYSMNRGGSSRL